MSVILGVDGSQHSVAALQLAVTEARCRSVDLHVVYVYEPARTSHAAAAASVMAGDMWTAQDTAGTVLESAQRRDAADRAEAQRHAEGWLRQFMHRQDIDLSGADVRLSAVGGEHPAAALVRLSHDADLLVVGSRGLGGFKGVLLGSISQHCVRHATCPVLVARLPRSDAETA
ncbi:MAG TPA: universal stress protein [Euzebyales bacterium]